MKKCYYWLIYSALIASCKQEEKQTLFSKIENSGISFTNKLQNGPDFNIFSYRNFYNGAGVAIGDLNNDGLPDVFMTANMGANKLFLNKGNFQFEDISEKAGFHDKQKWSTGVVMADVNADGLLDIYVCNAGFQKGVGQDNELWINKGNLIFDEQAAAFGLNDPGFTTHAAFFDYDLDGDLDCYILNNSFIPVNTLNYSNKRDLRAKDWPVADFIKGGGDRLMRNDNGIFTDVSEAANIYGSLIGFGLGVTVGDVNGDHYPDIYVSNDFFERDYLYINQKDGSFKDDLENRISHLSHSSMGADMADINNDGHPDIFVTEMLPDNDYRLKTTTTFENFDVQKFKVNSGFYYQFMQNTLQLNDREGKFREIAHYAGVAASDWSWGALMFDADNDGFNDIYISNGIYNDVTDQDFIDFFANDVMQKMVLTGKKEEIEEIIKKMPSVPLQNKMYRNTGNLRFNDMATPWGMTDKTFSNGAAYGDLDNDGDLDLIVSNVNQPALIYKNNSREMNKNHYLKVRLSGNEKNTQAIGSLVKIYSDSLVLMRELLPSRGFQSSVDYTLQFGLGTKTKVDSMVITWPDRTYTRVLSPGVDTLLRIAQQNTYPANDFNEKRKTLFETQANNFDKHTEDDFVDFNSERNIPQRLSKEGPAAAIADINKDGMEDIYISGTLKQAGQLYLQTAKGFVKHNGFKEPLPTLEITATVFFDADADGDADLFLGAGGNHQPSYGIQMQNRLYLNDGKGNFSLSPNPLPKNMGNTSVLLAHDIDGDGDLDLFAASRSMPSNYGVTPKSVCYINDGKGVFKLLPEAQSAPLTEAGMITGAVWMNLDNDKEKELIVVGDWMAPRTFKFSGNKFIEIKTNLSAMHGWWQSVASADLDGDGDDDLVLGNLGENFYLKPDVKQPVKLWINAFSKSMMPEKIITRSINNKDVPVFLKRDLTDQIPTLKKQNLLHGEYANKSIQELFDETLIKTSKVKEVNYTRSCFAWNEGNGKFTISEMPYPLQLSSVNAILVSDVNNDRRPDILLGGNLLDWLPQFSRVDGSYGHLLLNMGSGKWDCVTPEKSGIDLDGAVKHIMPIKVQSNQQFIFLRNSELPVMYSIKSH